MIGIGAVIKVYFYIALIVIGVCLAVLYFIIKAAVKNGMKQAIRDLKKREEL